jgi:diguanylate cyclase (GGDEF)-like protein
MVQEAKLSAVLREFARTLVTDFPIQGILDHLVERIVEILPVTSAGVTLIAPGAKPRYIAASDDAALRYEALQSEVGEGPCLVAYDSGVAVAVSDLAADDRFPRFGPLAVAAGLAAVFTFPLWQDSIRLGALDLYRDCAGGLDAEDMEAAQTLADVAAAYLTNVQARSDAHAVSDAFRQSALHDALTGLPNRLLLSQRLEHAAQRGHRSHTAAALLFADLDRFKDVNDSYGHKVGDGLLVAVARRLSGLLRPGDTLARVSGDEFVILCEDLQDDSDVEMLANRIDQAFTFPFHVDSHRIRITASVGIAFGGRGEDMTDQLMGDADMAMYHAKRNGGAGHQIIDLREANRVSQWHQLERDVRTAVTGGGLDVHYQPVVRSADGQLTGVEALLRWTHPSSGPVPPQQLVTIAEQNGSIAEVGAFVLERACRDRRHWLQRYSVGGLEVAVNVSTTQLMTHGFPALVADILHRTDTDPHALILEMSENIFIDDNERAQSILHDLRTLGVQLALDDFGTGYSSLSYLRSFPVDILKVDRAFLTDIGTDRVATIILAAVTNLAHELGISVTAEGIETQTQRSEVAFVGCDRSQGYFYARPMPATDIAHLLRNQGGSPARLPATADAGFDKYDDMLHTMVNGLGAADQQLVLAAVDASRHRRASPPATPLEPIFRDASDPGPDAWAVGAGS